MRLPEVSKTVQVPDNVTLSVDGKKINVKGAKGTLTRDFSFAPISIEGEGKTSAFGQNGHAKRKLLS
jgi:large subunit ribosomal protein L6